MCYPCCDSARVKSLKTCHCLHEIPEAFNELKPCLLEEASEVTDWFENNHVLGRIRQATVARRSGTRWLGKLRQDASLRQASTTQWDLVSK